jgi:hypothetical protein
MNKSISTKMNKIRELKEISKKIKKQIEPLIEEVKDYVLHNGEKDDNGNWVLVNGKNKALVTTTIKVDSKEACDYLRLAKRDDLIIIKESTTSNLLSQIMGEEDMTKNGLASYNYSLRVTPKE